MLLYTAGIVQKPNSDTERVFSQITTNFLLEPVSSPSQYVKLIWDRYENLSIKNNNMNGKIFEAILSTMCIRENLLPLFLSARVAFVPNIIYDLMFYSPEFGPICLSAKTSLRERYKQADLEAIALKYVHRKSQSYLITLEKKEANIAKTKIKNGDIIGLDDVIVATDPEFDTLIQKIASYTLERSPSICVINSNQIITKENISSNNNP